MIIISLWRFTTRAICLPFFCCNSRIAIRKNEKLSHQLPATSCVATMIKSVWKSHKKSHLSTLSYNLCLTIAAAYARPAVLSPLRSLLRPLRHFCWIFKHSECLSRTAAFSFSDLGLRLIITLMDRNVGLARFFLFLWKKSFMLLYYILGKKTKTESPSLFMRWDIKR